MAAKAEQTTNESHRYKGQSQDLQQVLDLFIAYITKAHFLTYHQYMRNNDFGA